MRFNCGPTRQEKDEKKKFWHKWFAWHPVKVGNREGIWLELVERKGTIWTSYGQYAGWIWEYRRIKT